jgi:hypothetical protein
LPEEELQLELVLDEDEEEPIIEQPLLCVHGLLEQLAAPISMAKNATAVNFFIIWAPQKTLSLYFRVLRPDCQYLTSILIDFLSDLDGC